MHIAASVLQLVLALAFLHAGWGKIVGSERQVANFQRWKYPQWFRLATGAAEWLGAAAMIVGIRYHGWAVVSGIWLAATMAGAVSTQVRAKSPLGRLAYPVALFLISLAVAGIQGSA